MKKYYLALASMICLFVAVSLVSCDKNDDEDPTSSSSLNFAEWVLPCLDWGASQSAVINYMSVYGDWSSLGLSYDNSILTFEHKNKRQRITYMFIEPSLQSLPLCYSIFSIENSSVNEFETYKSFLQSKLTFTMLDRDDSYSDGICYCGVFKYEGRTHALILYYIKSENTVSCTFMQKPND